MAPTKDFEKYSKNFGGMARCCDFVEAELAGVAELGWDLQGLLLWAKLTDDPLYLTSPSLEEVVVGVGSLGLHTESCAILDYHGVSVPIMLGVLLECVDAHAALRKALRLFSSDISLNHLYQLTHPPKMIRNASGMC